VQANIMAAIKAAGGDADSAYCKDFAAACQGLDLTKFLVVRAGAAPKRAAAAAGGGGGAAAAEPEPEEVNFRPLLTPLTPLTSLTVLTPLISMTLLFSPDISTETNAN
jgi:hypothetical protein